MGSDGEPNENETIGEFIEAEIPNTGDVVHAYGFRIENVGTYPLDLKEVTDV